MQQRREVLKNGSVNTPHTDYNLHRQHSCSFAEPQQNVPSRSRFIADPYKPAESPLTGTGKPRNDRHAQQKRRHPFEGFPREVGAYTPTTLPNRIAHNRRSSRTRRLIILFESSRPNMETLDERDPNGHADARRLFYKRVSEQ